MKSVGLVTLYKRNYGSALQCYATKTAIERMGFRCEVLSTVYKGADKYRYYAKEALALAKNSVRYRGYYHNYMSMRAAGKFSIGSLSKEAAFRLDLFAKANLQVREYSYDMLRKIGNEERFCYFLTGSDQVWSGGRKADPVYFLRFAPEEKRIAFAPSFGSNEIADFNRKPFARYISEIPVLSAREERGVELIKELTGREAVRLPDPTLLLTGEDWRRFASKAKKIASPYLLVHFLDEPSDLAIETIRKIAAERKLKTVVFAYPHSAFAQSADGCMVDGGAEDYVSLIDGAELVCTDSFHSSLFSVNLHRKFLVFPRQYRHANAQTSRLDTLLKLFNCPERMILNREKDAEAIAFSPLPDTAEVLAKERERAFDYLHAALKTKESTQKTIPALKDRFSCTGCGVCSQVCPKAAIKMLPNEYGYTMPCVEPALCVQCGICEKACQRELPGRESRLAAYLAYNTDRELAGKSASGGAFSALAAAVLRSGCLVYGAAMSFENGEVSVAHRRVETIEELPSVLGSKYVQSDCKGVYKEIGQALTDGKTVLFCGTSCQVAGLYRYLQPADRHNLYTVDLVCHGVPGEKLFSDYIRFLNEEFDNELVSFSFRTKGEGIQYEAGLRFKGGTSVKIPWEKSSYYKMFMSMNSYRDSCYNCEYASVNKPADITVGDYFEAERDYPALFSQLKNAGALSCLLVRGEKGFRLLEQFGDGLKRFEVDADRVQSSHNNLCRPSTCTKTREEFFETYWKAGFRGVEKQLKRRDALLKLPKMVSKK